jgi:hypothetical protein
MIERRTNLHLRSLVDRIKSEYLEMPGLSLTRAQASRLWALDDSQSRTILAILVTRGFLTRTPRGQFRMPSTTDLFGATFDSWQTSMGAIHCR